MLCATEIDAETGAGVVEKGVMPERVCVAASQCVYETSSASSG